MKVFIVIVVIDQIESSNDTIDKNEVIIINGAADG
jgi:hypothetical protein